MPTRRKAKKMNQKIVCNYSRAKEKQIPTPYNTEVGFFVLMTELMFAIGSPDPCAALSKGLIIPPSHPGDFWGLEEATRDYLRSSKCLQRLPGVLNVTFNFSWKQEARLKGPLKALEGHLKVPLKGPLEASWAIWTVKKATGWRERCLHPAGMMPLSIYSTWCLLYTPVTTAMHISKVFSLMTTIQWCRTIRLWS